MDITGTIEKLMPVQDVTATFRKRELVIRTEEQYPQPILFEFVQDKTAELDGFAEGEKVRVSFDVRGREWKSPQGDVKYFNSLRGWRVQREAAAQQPPATQATAQSAAPNFAVPPADFKIDEADDDLPF